MSQIEEKGYTCDVWCIIRRNGPNAIKSKKKTHKDWKLEKITFV